MCRCGYEGPDTKHPCHGKAYSCRKPATSKFVARPVALAGMQPKLGAYQTWACDECWAEYKEQNNKP